MSRAGSMFEHVNEPSRYERMHAIRDHLGDLHAADGEPTDEQAYEVGKMFEGDGTMFTFMDERPGDWLLNGSPADPNGYQGPGGYYDGKGREGWHSQLRRLRNGSDAFWAGMKGEPLAKETV